MVKACKALLSLIAGPVAMGLLAVPAQAQQATPPQDAPLVLTAQPSQAEAESQFLYAHEQYRNAFANIAGTSPTPTVVSIFSDPTQEVVGGGENASNIVLDDIPIVVDVENRSLKEVVTEIVSQAADTTGPWTVKWRLKPENMGLLDERVNLTAEAPFGRFVSLLSERIRNMSGVQIYFKTFQQARVVMIADTYY